MHGSEGTRPAAKYQADRAGLELYRPRRLSPAAAAAMAR